MSDEFSKRFTFNFVVGGQAVGFGAMKAMIGSDGLRLGKELIPYEVILDTTTRGKRVVIQLADSFDTPKKIAKKQNEDRVLVLQLRSWKARKLEMAIDRQCSTLEAEARQRDLKAKGLEHLIRSETCPVCSATVDLSGLDITPLVYCRFCESIFTSDGTTVTDGNKYRVCEGCGFYARSQVYPEFYFYFLIVVSGFSHKKRLLCDACAHRLFLKALGLNLIFLVGVPSAIWIKIKSLIGRDLEGAALSDANAAARRGQYQEAAMGYEVLLRRHGDHPAILMNEAMGYIRAGEGAKAGELLGRSADTCSNYVPTLRILHAASRSHVSG